LDGSSDTLIESTSSHQFSVIVVVLSGFINFASTHARFSDNNLFDENDPSGDDDAIN